MDIFNEIHTDARYNLRMIKTVDMHTSGEPTRIVIDGYPYEQMNGDTLLDTRRCVRETLDHVRKLIMREPRGHAEMYGAILVPETELTLRGDADIGVLFCHNEGYSTMCGHATIALGRFLIDTRSELFPRRKALRFDEERATTELRLHAPCGVVRVTVPTVDGRSDPTRAVSFLSVPSFVAHKDLVVSIPKEKQWPRLRDSERQEVRVDVAYGGAFYAIVSADELGFKDGFQGAYELKEFDEATAALKGSLVIMPDLCVHPREKDLEYLYGVMVVDSPGAQVGSQTGLCYFADQQVDRSPTGSCVSAQVALAVEKRMAGMGEALTFESLVSLQHRGNSFQGTAVEKVKLEDGREGIVVKVEGKASYIGVSTFIVEEQDEIKDGFVFSLPRE